jgi:hypothetical protein
MGFQVGNKVGAAGRPPNSRALAVLLREAGEKKIRKNGHFVARNLIVAEGVYELLTLGETILPNKTKIKVNARDWLELVKFVHTHVDGPARVEMDVTSGGEPIKTYISWSPAEWDEQQADAIDNGAVIDATARLTDGKR